MAESLVLDGLNLNTGSYVLFSMNHTPAKKRAEWADNSDGDGSLLIRDPYSDNCQWDVVVEVRAASRDAAHTAVGVLTDKLEEAERQPLGIPLVWTPDNSTKSVTWYVLTGELKVPIDMQSGYLANPPVLQAQMSLTCRPFGYGAEVTVAAVASGAVPVQIFSVAGVTGDVDAEARLIASDTATQSRDFAAWGREYRYQAGADLLLTQPDLTATGFAGTSTTRAGSVSTNIYRGTLTTSPVAVCGSGNQPHVGVFRVYARVWASGPGVMVRLSYREGDGPLSSLSWELPPAEDAWVELDLGVVTIPPKLLGTQRWQGQVEAYTDTPGDTLDVDYLVLMPAETFGRARRPFGFETPSSFSGWDGFGFTGALNARVAPAGGTWGGAGDADDFAGGGTTTDLSVLRTAVSDVDANTGRYAPLGATNYAASMAQTDLSFNVGPSSAKLGVLLRYVDTNNWLMATVDPLATSVLSIRKRVAGTVTTLASPKIGALAGYPRFYTVRLQADVSGRWAAWFWPLGGNPGNPVAVGQDTVLATGGTLASGKPGLYDANPSATAVTRRYDSFMVAPLTSDAVCFASQSIEFRSDDTIREDSTGVYYGRPEEYRGAPFFVPPAGDEARTSRVAVMMRRNDPYTLSNANVTDAQTVEVRYTPRYLYLPR